MPLLFELGLFNICISEEERAEQIVYLFSEEMDALLDDDEFLELNFAGMEFLSKSILGSCGAHNITIKTIFSRDTGFTEIWFSFTTSPLRSRRHMDFINLPLP